MVVIIINSHNHIFADKQSVHHTVQFMHLIRTYMRSRRIRDGGTVRLEEVSACIVVGFQYKNQPLYPRLGACSYANKLFKILSADNSLTAHRSTLEKSI